MSAGEGQLLDLELPRESRAPSLARNAIEQATRGVAALEAHRDELALLGSEVVTNAVVHPVAPPDSGMRLGISVAGNRVRVEVVDPGSGFPPADEQRAPQRERGYGLLLLERMAAAWGSRLTAEGFLVWFELDLTSGAC